MVKTTRKFDGLNYGLKSRHSTKAQARKVALASQKSGKRTRLVKVGSKWAVYHRAGVQSQISNFRPTAPSRTTRKTKAKVVRDGRGRKYKLTPIYGHEKQRYSKRVDKSRKAGLPGRRVSKDHKYRGKWVEGGNVYYESRKNRADVNRKIRL